ncbi:hypothetical protein SALBM311S_08210 [Streptomyces alboniger]
MNTERVRAIQRACLDDVVRMLGHAAPDSRVWEGHGVKASVCPSAPDQPMVNVVAATSDRALLDALGPIETAYRSAGVRSWWAWSEDHDDTNKQLEEAGYRRNVVLPAMIIELDGLTPPDLDGLDYDAEADMPTLARVTETAHAAPSVTRALVRRPPALDVRIYAARHEGRVACVLATIDHTHPEGNDCGIQFVGTLPEARRHGIASRLVSAAMADARARGCVTASGQSSLMGAHLYTDLGFRTVSHLAIHERSAP